MWEIAQSNSERVHGKIEILKLLKRKTRKRKDSDLDDKFYFPLYIVKIVLCINNVKFSQLVYYSFV